MSLILASTSAYRKQLLEQMGLSFRSLAPKLDEDRAKQEFKADRQLAASLAKQKALSLREDHTEEWILAADQLVFFKDQVLGKPGRREKAFEILSQLQGKTHELVTSFFLSGPKKDFAHTDITRLHMRPLTSEEIESYIERDLPLDCAGSYKLEKAGICLFDKIESEDFSAIQGLPLIAFSQCWLKATGQLPFRTQGDLPC